MLKNDPCFFQWIVRFRRLVLDFCFTCIHFFGISATSWRTYLRCWTYTFGSAKRVTIIDARAVARCLNVMGLVSLKMGVIGTLLIVIFMFHDLDNWKIKVTMAVITLFYGVVFKLIAYVVEQRVLNHYVH